MTEAVAVVAILLAGVPCSVPFSYAGLASNVKWIRVSICN